jgi:hypothetical protein
VEKEIADVMTEKQKIELKTLYKKQVEQYDWAKAGDKLRTAYDKVDWNRVNDQLTEAMNLIRSDSLQKIYNKALADLAEAKIELSSALKSYADSMKLKEFETAKLEMQRSLDKLKAVKSRKIVHL